MEQNPLLALVFGNRETLRIAVCGLQCMIPEVAVQAITSAIPVIFPGEIVLIL